MNHNPFTTATGTTLPACLAHEPEATGFTLAATEADVDCPLCNNPRKARKYAREFAQRHTGPKAPAMRLTSCGSAMVAK